MGLYTQAYYLREHCRATKHPLYLLSQNYSLCLQGDVTG